MTPAIRLHRRFLLVVSLLCILLVGASVPVAAASATIEGTTFSGPHVASADENVTYIWQSRPGTFDVRLRGEGTTDQYRLCLQTGGSSSCQYEWVGGGETKVVKFPSAVWNDSTGRQNLSVTLSKQAAPGEVLDRAHTTVFVLQTGGDLDGDGLSNEREFGGSTRFDDADSDDDGLRDGEEVNNYGTNPLSADSDGDGLRDQGEITVGSSPTNVDSDGDGFDDSAEVAAGLSPTAPNPDPDGDGLSNHRESELGTDPMAADTDDDFLNDRLEVQLGTNPTSPLMTRILGVLLLLAGLGLVVRVWQSRGRWSAAGDADDDPAAALGPAERNEVLSDEEHVIEMLEENGGRMPQRQITERREWSKSKVSRLLSKMEEEGEINKISTGRENLITLHDQVPDGAKTILDEDSE